MREPSRKNMFTFGGLIFGRIFLAVHGGSIFGGLILWILRYIPSHSAYTYGDKSIWDMLNGSKGILISRFRLQL